MAKTPEGTAKSNEFWNAVGWVAAIGAVALVGVELLDG